MKTESISVKQQKILAFLVVVSLIVGFLFLQSYFILVAVAIILAYIFNPIYQWSLNKFKQKSSLAVTVTVIALFATFAIPLTAILYVTVTQAIELLNLVTSATVTNSSLSEAISDIITSINREISRVPWAPDEAVNTNQVLEWLKNVLEVVLSSSVAFVRGFVGGVAGFFTNLIIFLFVFSSILKNQDKLLKMLEDINPLGKVSSRLYLGKMGAMTTAMVKGQFMIALAQGFSGVVSLWFVGSDFLAFWFVLLTFLSIIPLGGGIILIPFGIGLILTGNIWEGALLLGWHFIITTNIDNVLRPKFVPKSAQLDPALTILSVFAGIGVFGFLGIVLGPVLMIVIVTTISSFLELKRTGEINIIYDENKKPKNIKSSRFSVKFWARK